MEKHLKTHYIGHILTKPVRRILMIMLWIAFFIISPSIILYTAGYRYDWKNRQIRQTGVLSVDVEPNDATVTLNNIQIEKDIPIKLSNRAPGTYSLKIERAGYKTWERDIVIESNNTTYIKGVTLIKDVLPIRLLSDTENIISAQGYNDSVAILKKIGDVFELHIINLSTMGDTLVYRISSEETPEVKVSPYLALAYSRVPGDKLDTLYIVSLTSPDNTHISSISKSATLTWNAVNTAEGLYKEEGGRITIASLPRTDRLIGTVSGTIWYKDREGKIWTANRSTITDLEMLTSYTLPDEIDSIIDINKDRIIATHKNNTMIAKINGQIVENVQTINGTNAYYNRRTGEWFVWSEWELSSVYPDAGVSLLNRSGDKIKEVTVLDQSGVLLLATEKELAAFNPGYYVRHTLAQLDDYQVVSVNTNKRTLYFWGTFGLRKGLYALEY